MKVAIKKMKVDMQVKNGGIEFEIRTPDDSEQLGDVILTSTKIIWCKGKTTKKNGISMTWEQFIKAMESKGK